MKKLFLFLVILMFPNVVFSSVDECKTDVYFANGILATPRQAFNNAEKVLKPEIIEMYGIQEYNKHIGKVDYTYNSTLSESKDMYEVYMQLKAEGGIGEFEEFMIKHFPLAGLLVDADIKKVLDEKVHEKMIKEVHDADLKKQIEKYRTSINDGHSVAVVAHSQGALFTNEAYDSLIKSDTDKWRKKFFRAFFVAPASTKVLDNDVQTPSFVFHNDVITNLSDRFNFPKTTNPNLFEKKVQGNYFGEYKYVSQKDKIFHSFEYYMGGSITYTDGRGDHNVSTNLAKDKIIDFIGKAVISHGSEDSQWIKDQEFKKDTCDYKMTVKHQHDPSIEMAEKVYPFNASKKLYQVNTEWVIASCGGKNIFGPDHEIAIWDGKQPNECFIIDNPQKETIKKEGFYDKVIFALRKGISGEGLPVILVQKENKLRLFASGLGYTRHYCYYTNWACSCEDVNMNWVVREIDGNELGYPYDNDNLYVFFEAESLEELKNNILSTWKGDHKSADQFGDGYNVKFEFQLTNFLLDKIEQSYYQGFSNELIFYREEELDGAYDSNGISYCQEY